jgi:hypothetical protein
MADTNVPWAGLAALLAMLLIPFLPSWWLEGPRRIRHWPRLHVCGACDRAWTEGHICELAAVEEDTGQRLRGDLRRSSPPAKRERRQLGRRWE